MDEGKGAGYVNWAKKFNIKQMAQTVNYLREHGLMDYDVLKQKTADATRRYNRLSDEIKAAEKRMAEIAVLKTHIINYSKTRDVYAAYRKSGYSKKYLAEHESEILLHKAAKKAFDELGMTKLPTVKSLQEEYADLLAEKLFANRDGYWPDLLSIDEILEKAENNTSGKPVIFVDAADSPNGGAVGDSIVPVMPLVERGSKVRAGMFLKDPEAVRQAFEVGVGKSAVFEIGNKITPSLPAPMKAEGRVRSLHDGWVRHEGPAEKGVPFNVGLSAVISFGNVDVMVCEDPAATGDPQLLRHFGIEPKLYDLIVVKANTSFKVPYSSFAGEICYADSPGAGSSNLKSFRWTKLPKGFYPFDLPEDYQPAKAKFWR